MDDTLGVGELEPSGGGEGDVEGLLERERALGVGEQVFNVAATHQLLDEERLLRAVRRGVLADVIDGNDVLVREAAHCLCFAHDPLATDVVESFGLDQGEGDVAVEQGVV